MPRSPRPAADLLILITAFAPGERRAIHAYAFGTADGRLKPLRLTAGAENLCFLALSRRSKNLITWS